MKTRIAVIAALFVGFGCGVLVNCDRDGKKSLELKVIPGLDKPVPWTDPGDTIKWFAADGTPLKVHFDPESPCDKKANDTDTCLISATQGMFPYTCTGCEDPTVPVGRNTILHGNANVAAGGRGATATPNPDGVYCDASNNAAVVSPVKGLTGQYFSWIAAGSSPPSDWTVTVPDNTCQEGNSFGPASGNYRCTITSPLTADVTYDVEVKSCSGSTKTQGKIVHR